MNDDEAIDPPMLWKPSRGFLKLAITFVFAGSLAYLIALFTFAPDQTARAFTVVLLLLVAATARFLLWRRGMKAAVRALGIGVWAYVTVTSFFLGGVNGTSIILYPLVILLFGWLVSTRAALALALWTAATTLGFVLVEMWGYLPVPPPTPPAMRWVIEACVFVLSAVLINHVVRSYRDRLAQVRELGCDLARRTAELQGREAELRRAQAVAHVGSWVYDLASDTLRWSDETCRILGLPLGTAGSRANYLSRVHPEDRGAMDAAWLAALKGGERFDNEHRIVVGETLRWVRQIAQLEYGADGTPRGGMGTTQDITQRKHQEMEILRARSQLSATLEAIPDLLFEVGLDGRIHNYHSPRSDFLVAPPEDFLGKKISDFLPPEAADVSMSALLEAHEKGYSQGKQYELALAHARMSFELSVSRKPVEPGKEPLFIALARDITERKLAEAARARLEAQLREAQKMEALGTLAGGVAHEFNNILATIAGNAELARQDVGPTHPAWESLQEIDQASLRAKGLVRQVLAFGRRQLLERKPISLVPVVDESMRLLRATLPAGVSLSVEPAPDAPALLADATQTEQALLNLRSDVGGVRLSVGCAPDVPSVLADATQIEQMLLNLCSNAWHAVQGQGRPGTIDVHLAAHVQTPGEASKTDLSVEIGTLQPGNYACLTVRDNGSGMDAQTVRRIFEPFFTTKPVGAGTGMGLSVVHGIAQDHGASIFVHSAEGAGTTIQVFFPAAEVLLASVRAQIPQPVRPDDGRAPASDAGSKRILYVDDDESIVFLIKRLLERQGYRVRAYTDARAALAAVRARPDMFDLAVTDYNMPGMSGLDVARALREIRSDLPVALVSGYITEALRADAPAAGVNELIYKPNTVDELCAAVARLATARPD